MTTTVTTATAEPTPTWIAELIADNLPPLRAEVVRLVNLHCYKTAAAQRDVWRSLYARLGVPLPAKNRLDYIEENGLMADLHRIAASL